MTASERPRGGDGDPRSGRGSDMGLLGAASLANGLLAYGFVALGTRAFGAAAFAPISVAWSLWAIGVAGLGFPFQHRLILAHTTGSDGPMLRRERRHLAGVAAAVALVVLVVLVVGRDAAFGSASLAYPTVTAAVVLGAGALGIARGDLAGSGRVRHAAGLLVSEQVLRVLVGAVVVAIGGSVVGFAWALPAGVLVGLAWRPAGATTKTAQPTGATDLATYLSSVAGGSVLAQLLLTGSPVVLALVGGDESSVTALFATLAVARAPFQVSQGVSIRVMGDLGRAVVADGPAALARFVRTTVAGTTAGAAVAAGVGWSAGPWLMRSVFGPDAALGAAPTAAVAAGAVLATGSLVLLLVLIVVARPVASVRARAVGALCFVAVVLLGTGVPVDRVVVGFALSEVVAFGVAAAAAWSTTHARGPATVGRR